MANKWILFDEFAELCSILTTVSNEDEITLGIEIFSRQESCNW